MLTSLLHDQTRDLRLLVTRLRRGQPSLTSSIVVRVRRLRDEAQAANLKRRSPDWASKGLFYVRGWVV